MPARWYVLATLSLLAACQQLRERDSLNRGSGEPSVAAAFTPESMISRPRAPAGTEQIANLGD